MSKSDALPAIRDWIFHNGTGSEYAETNPSKILTFGQISLLSLVQAIITDPFAPLGTSQFASTMTHRSKIMKEVLIWKQGYTKRLMT